MNLSYKQSVIVLKQEGVNQWGDPLYGDKVTYTNIELERRPIFKTEHGKRVIIQQALLTLYVLEITATALVDDSWVGARVIDDYSNVWLVQDFEVIHEENEPIKYQLNLEEGRY